MYGSPVDLSKCMGHRSTFRNVRVTGQLFEMYASPVDLWKCMGHIDLIHYVLAGMSRLVRVVPFSTTGSVLQNAKETITFEQPDMQMLLGKVLCMPPGRARGTVATQAHYSRKPKLTCKLTGISPSSLCWRAVSQRRKRTGHNKTYFAGSICARLRSAR